MSINNRILLRSYHTIDSENKQLRARNSELENAISAKTTSKLKASSASEELTESRLALLNDVLKINKSLAVRKYNIINIISTNVYASKNMGLPAFDPKNTYVYGNPETYTYNLSITKNMSVNVEVTFNDKNELTFKLLFNAIEVIDTKNKARSVMEYLDKLNLPPDKNNFVFDSTKEKVGNISMQNGLVLNSDNYGIRQPNGQPFWVSLNDNKPNNIGTLISCVGELKIIPLEKVGLNFTVEFLGEIILAVNI